MKTKPFTSRHGMLVARALATSWREHPEPFELSDEALAEIAPILVKSGSAGFVWWRLSQTARSSPAEFLEAYKQQTLEAAVHEADVADVFHALETAKIKALAIKGWAVARSYPNAGLRRYSDLDLCVAAEDYSRTLEVLSGETTKNIWVDMHRGSPSLDYEPEDELFARSMQVPVNNSLVRIPAPEDHLRILCLHLLRHGCWRPLWLCDVALMLESRDQTFDWKVFFGHDKNRADWLACVLGLAHVLLGARVSDSPVAERAKKLPGWLPRSILRRWGRWYNADYRDKAWPSLRSHTTQPMRLLEDAYFRCDPIRATVEVGGGFNDRPRLPYQIAALARRAIAAARTSVGENK